MIPTTIETEKRGADSLHRMVSRTDQTKTAWYIRPLVEAVRNLGINGCEAKAQQLASRMNCCLMANVGGGRNTRWPNAVCTDAMHVRELDFNTRPLPFTTKSLDLVVCEQVIEHLHNTTWFLRELFRITKPGGNLLLSTENLASLPNIFALACQRAPFSTQALCGQFLGGWKDGPAGYGDGVEWNHPTYAGVHGHVRVMTVGQLKAVVRNAGFTILGKWGFGGNHYVILHATRPANDLSSATGPADETNKPAA
jgi:SAM-dependent methyltransferase